jgi:hypothetical protein
MIVPLDPPAAFLHIWPARARASTPEGGRAPLDHAPKACCSLKVSPKPISSWYEPLLVAWSTQSLVSYQWLLGFEF